MFAPDLKEAAGRVYAQPFQVETPTDGGGGARNTEDGREPMLLGQLTGAPAKHMGAYLRWYLLRRNPLRRLRVFYLVLTGRAKFTKT